MKVYGLFYGGVNYSTPDINIDLEVFPSITAAKEALLQRYRSNMTQLCASIYADGRRENVVHLADETAEIQLFLYDPRETSDPYPDCRVYIGPRHGICFEIC